MTGDPPHLDIESLLAALARGAGNDAEAASAEAASAEAEAAIQSCMALSPAESAAVLKRLTQAAVAPDPDLRWWALRALAVLPHIDPLPLLTAALHDADAAVRQCAALGLRMRPDARAVPALVAALADADPLTARLAVDALVAVGPQAVPALLEVVTAAGPSAAPHPAARLGALRALAAIADTRAVPALFAALDGSTLEEYWANQGLERMGVGMSFFKP